MSNSLKEEMPEIVEMEFEALKAIYLEDISIEGNNCETCMASIVVDVYPRTGHDIEDQFVKLTLVINIPKNYPNRCPSFEFKNVRSLTDDKIEEVKSEINVILKEKSGETLVYDIIERSRDLLTTLNFPVGNRCAICLYELTAMDEVVRNECFHHLHSRCFADYVLSTQHNYLESIQKTVDNDSEISIQCPVCRIQLKSTDWKRFVDPDKYSMPYLSRQPLVDELSIIQEAKANQKCFQQLYEKQLKSGGIIDTETDRNKFVLRISETNDQMILS